MVKCILLVYEGKEIRQEVDDFYEKHKRLTRARDTDIFIVAESPGGIIGSVRFCVEDGVPMLRGMLVDEKFRGLGIGMRLLKEFEIYLNEHNYKNCHCLPYAHLDKFYATVGFRKIDVGIPPFLQQRMEEYNSKNMGVICMRRA
jgi:N-acetylglutamate synthase-like GNAT family acetyltransferase